MVEAEGCAAAACLQGEAEAEIILNKGEVEAKANERDMPKMAAQIPALFETLSGMPMSDLLKNVKTIGEKPNGQARQ